LGAAAHQYDPSVITSSPDRRVDRRAAEAGNWSAAAVTLGWLIAGLGAVLRVRQYLTDRSLWRDEASLTYNILHRGYLGFAHPLRFEQGTPPGFFVVEKAASQMLGTSELALRAVPLACALGSLVVAVVLVRRHVDQVTGLVALALCATSPFLVYFASEVKQYSTDTLVVLLVLLAASTAWRRGLDRRSCLWLALTGAVALFFSHAAVFALIGVGLPMAWGVWRQGRKELLGRLALVGTTWVVVFAVLYATLERHLNDDKFLRDFWRAAFLPVPPTDSAGLHRWGDALRTLFVMLAGNGALVWLLAPLAIVGIVSLARRWPGVLAVVLVLWASVVLASALQRYPATERLVLFLLPPLALLVGAGTAAVARALAARVELAGTAVAVLVCVLCASVALHRFVTPVPVEELRPLLTDVEHDRQPGDVVFVSETAVPAYEYYRSRLSLPTGRVVESDAGIGDTAALQRAATALSDARRIWVVTAAYWQPEGHVTPNVLAAFDRIGTRVEERDAPGATVVLYRPGPAG
jgi:4-amino-4-deoxy-L-arabinose transferase-like glycosyltransferase